MSCRASVRASNFRKNEFGFILWGHFVFTITPYYSALLYITRQHLQTVGSTLLLPVTLNQRIMEHTQPFSVLNERLRPQITTNEQSYSSLNKLDDGQVASLRSKSSPLHRQTVLPTKPEPKDTISEPSEQQDLVIDGENCADLMNDPIFATELNSNDSGEELVDDNRSVSSSEEKDHPGELTSEGLGHPSQCEALDGEGGSPFERSCLNGTLPDLLNGGKLLSRRRTLGHVSETLKEVRREVELSRRRSIKLKAQVDKLQESKDGPGWSKQRLRVKDEVLSILRLLHPLTESGSSLGPNPSHEDHHLDTSLAQLQDVARQLAFNYNNQFQSGKGKGSEESAILQQALRDRDDAIEKKKAMEAELLRSKTEMMLLNNQLLEAVQKRLELSLELETWKDDVQRILHQQLQSQQQAEAQKKPTRLGILRRNIKPPIQRPANFPLSQPTSPITNPKQIFIPRAAVSSAPTPSTPPSTQRNWRDKLRRTKRTASPDPGQESEAGRDGDSVFQVISLD
ncbi:bicaudal-D-related protein 2-like [Clinocottus analis]|uniref:bicaudal-D-related protein 2-like n=1 Tax=Clinocottus analis TaxID=304258 RepID=UPI0035C204DB